MVKDAKHQYQELLDTHFHQIDLQGMLHGLHTINDYKAKHTATINTNSALANKLKKFFNRFKDRDIISDEHVISIVEHDVRAALRTVNTRATAGPDGITGHLLCCCADQLTGVFAFIFNESLGMVPMWFKRSTIFPVTEQQALTHELPAGCRSLSPLPKHHSPAPLRLLSQQLRRGCHLPRPAHNS